MRKERVIIAIPVAHTFLFQDICLSQLVKFDPGIANIKVVVVTNSHQWSDSYKNAVEWSMQDDLPFPIEVIPNDRASTWHGTALDCAVEHFDADYFFAMEPDVLILSDDWLSWFIRKMEETVDCFSVGHWHAEGFVNPSATLYRMDLLKEAFREFRANKDPMMYWGPNFERSENIIAHYDRFLDDVGPFSEKRGWPPGTRLKGPTPSGQLRGPGWYEPAQQLHHWAVEKGFSYVSVPCQHYIHPERKIPVGTYYRGDTNTRPFKEDLPEGADFLMVHVWGGTRALDILKHPVSDPTVNNNAEFWLRREAALWKKVVPAERKQVTLRLMRESGWYNRPTTEREDAAVRTVLGYYEKEGLVL